MDTELAEMKECIARIDERTATILSTMEKQNQALSDHEERDRQDFKEVHQRINRVERKQNWFLGIGSAVIFSVSVGVSVGIAFLKNLFGG